jgi:hypothetical protein
MSARRFGKYTWSWILGALVFALVGGGWLGAKWYRERSACERRGAALDARIRRLEEQARRRIGIGTKHGEVVRFLQENGLNVTTGSYSGSWRTVGTASDVGCPDIFGCGDEALIGVEVNVDESGNVISAPKVETMYSDCM